LYPPALFDLLNDMEEIVNYVIEIASDEFGEDEITVKVGADVTSDELLLKIKDRFRAKLRVSPKIVFASIEDINRMWLLQNDRKSVMMLEHLGKHLTDSVQRF